mgnify:CR=1 FL=1
MNTYLKCQWQDPRIDKFELSKLTPMDGHDDGRWEWRDLPRIREQGLWYPILLYKVTPEWWHTKYIKWRPKIQTPYEDPIVNEDGMIWAVKMGSNRYLCARYLGYQFIDCIMFEDSNDCVKLGVWLRECDPLNNKDAEPYQGKFSY